MKKLFICKGNRKKTNNLYGFIMGKNLGLKRCHTFGLHLDLFKITGDLDDDLYKTVLFNKDKSEAQCINCNNPLPE